MHPKKILLTCFLLMLHAAKAQSLLEIKCKMDDDSLVQITSANHIGWEAIAKTTHLPIDSLNRKPEILDLLPQRLESFINRWRVPNGRVYELDGTECYAYQFVFREMDTLGYHFTFQFAASQNGYFEDFDNGNALNIGMDAENPVHLFIRGIDKTKNVATKNVEILVKGDGNLLKDFQNAKWRHWLVIVSFPFMVFLFFLYRHKILKEQADMREKASILEQRNEMTADLHDDIGASLSSLNINISIINRLLKSDKEKAILLLNKIENQSQQLSDKLSDFIWSVKSNDDDAFMKLNTRIMQFVHDILGSTDILYKMDLDKKADEIRDIKIKKSVVLLIKEAVNNIAKYSKAQQAIIKITVIGRTLKIQVKDDGIGFDPYKAKGNGLKNITSRAAILKGKTEILSEPSGGTEILIELPI